MNGNLWEALKNGGWLLTLLVAGVMAIHLDKRYVQLETYLRDRERDREMRALVESQINQRFDQTEKKLEEIEIVQ